MFSVSLSPSHTSIRTHTHIHTHCHGLYHNEAEVVSSTCKLQCEVSNIKTKRMNYDPSFKPRAICYRKVVTLVISTVTAPCNLFRSFCAVSLGSRVTVPLGAGCMERESRAWQLNKSLFTSVFYFSVPKMFFLRSTHKMKSTVPQCVINFVLIFFPDRVVAKPAAIIREGEVYNRVHTEA